MIRVIIDRHIAETLETAYDDAARRTLQQAYQAPGFLSGEVLTDAHNRRHRVILSDWRSELDWQNWHASDARRAMMDQLRPMLETDEKITVLEHS